MRLILEMPAQAKAVAEVRRAVRERLGEAGAEVELCVSELLSNVVQHVGEGTPVTVDVSPTRVAVTDPDPHRLPVPPQHEDPGAESGRGLALLAAVSARWGVTRRPDGKTVWCELLPDGQQTELDRKGEDARRWVSPERPHTPAPLSRRGPRPPLLPPQSPGLRPPGSSRLTC
ncbi:ATP-binding protein [Streptomyces sp. B-S-A8]|uniref:ATP-binding protein n=1 Tax=Streptomyces solicavernae TaxID=3043614 RepID=A0ABT6RN21_9ACTN|nr:ATP-binding protein [Streptomyces sp. B-S-A8]MDI3385659.1 ATP-binding protein [Streptomyces sp. B-S-A8]